jgi:hypothetical protein
MGIKLCDLGLWSSWGGVNGVGGVKLRNFAGW